MAFRCWSHKKLSRFNLPSSSTAPSPSDNLSVMVLAGILRSVYTAQCMIDLSQVPQVLTPSFTFTVATHLSAYPHTLSYTNVCARPPSASIVCEESTKTVLVDCINGIPDLPPEVHRQCIHGTRAFYTHWEFRHTRGPRLDSKENHGKALYERDP